MNHKRKNPKKKRPHERNMNSRDNMQQNLNKIVPDVKIKKESEKLSDVIKLFAHPFLRKSKTEEQQERFIAIAVWAWNYCVLPKKDAVEYKKSFYDLVCEDDLQDEKDIEEVLDFLIQRKLHQFKDDTRLIVSYNMEKTEEGWQLSVVYTE